MNPHYSLLATALIIAGCCPTERNGAASSTVTSGPSDDTRVSIERVEPDESFIDSFRFLDSFDAGECLALAVDLQRTPVESEMRANYLAVIATDPEQAHYTYALCRMLFKAAEGETFREPMLGQSVHVTDGQWPLSPIKMQNGVPFVIAAAYNLGGTPESPLSYLIYCLVACEWSGHEYEPATRQEIAQAAEALIVTHNLKGSDADKIRRQVSAVD